MKRKPYIVLEKSELLKSKAIEKVANSSATYSKEFKVFAAGEYLSGKTPMQIFVEAGINVNILGREQPTKCLQRWRKIHDKYGINALLEESRGVRSSGRPRKIPLTLEELVEKVDEYMYYYNNKRYQWSKLKMAPVEYRNHLLNVS